ncbi:MAG: DUF1080 domain-containing protein [Planctomycetes bacterium]|nr:DUF1080 domain-containing protein [Planctomycetota bacterium]
MQPIFNGKDLTGWWTPGNKKAWVARDGEIVLAARGGNYLRTEKLHANYTFSFEYRTPKNTNSGVGIRTARNGWPSGDGMELQIHTSAGLGYGAMMSLYRNVPPLARGEKIEDWNRVVVKADGRMITAWVNGVMTQHCNTAWEAELKHRPLTGWIGFQDHGRTIRIRNLNVLAAPDGLGMDGWRAPRDLPAARVVLDRLMNTDRLAHDDGIGSGTAGKTIGESDEQVIADLKGPGGVVRVTAIKPKGNVALYFDDEEKPRLQCPLAALGQNVPRIAQQGPVLLTYVGYKQRLRIVATGAAGSTVRVEYVTLPKADSVTSWSKTDNAIPRGVLAALDYRRHQHSHGTFRRNDPYERPTKQGLSIAAGKSTRVIARDGAGLVHFVQFHGNKKHLANDDLWIEVRVDGQSDPALAAPLRYYYAPLASGGNFNNYLFTERGGQVCRLAMPFGRGIQIDLVNRGKQTIHGVGLTASIQPGKQFAKLMRLRGVFTKAGEKKSIRQTGSGRLIGLVVASGEKTVTVKALRVDGQLSPSPGQLLGNLTGAQNFRNMLAGRQGGLAWRYLLLAPIGFNRSIELSVEKAGDRLALFYMKR